MMRIARLRKSEISMVLVAVLMHSSLAAAQHPAPPPVPPPVVPPGFGPRVMQGQEPAAQTPAQPAPGQAGTQQAPALPGAPPTALMGGINLQNVNLTEVVDFLARQLKINYIMDKGVGGGVTLNTYGPAKDLDYRSLLDTVLRINGAAMVQTGDVYRIVQLNDIARMPLPAEVDAKNIPEDDRPILNMIFLKYANVEELSKLIGDFLGPQGRAWSYGPANLLLVLDSRRSMKRTMEMIALFDSDVLAKQRVKLFDVQHSKPSDLAKEIEGLLKSMSLSKELSSVKFVPVDRINTLIAVAPNPGVFDQIQEWIAKLDVKVKTVAGKTDTYVYRVKYGRADAMAGSIMMLYMQMYPGFGGYPGMGGMYGGGMYGGGMYGGGMYGGGMYGAGMYGAGMYGAGMYGAGAAGQPGSAAAGQPAGAAGTAAGPNQAGMTGMGGDLTGSYLGMGGMSYGYGMRGPRVVPNQSDNSLLILATPEEYDGVIKMLRELDVPPRQVLIEAKIYEVKLTGALSWGLSWYINNKNSGIATPLDGSPRNGAAGFASSALNLTASMLVGQSRQLLAALSTQEVATKTKIISTPSIIATDSIAASINVGTEVPTLTAQAVTGVQQGGSSLFANTVSNRRTGVTLAITARVNPSGIVTLIVNQEVSSPAPPPVGGIQSPSFNQRSVQTQVTVQDGDMIAIGGIISETNGETTSGVPFLHRLPILGYAFGNKSFNKERTEMVVFLTPRVIYDTNEMSEASDELLTGLRRLQKIIR
ncbi:MAG: type II secretion system secretin GspD [Candidatus Solibacter usitatus]|nr:type II secretion system secretin GspD [Candidatus Solibacter usitatus]